MMYQQKLHDGPVEFTVSKITDHVLEHTDIRTRVLSDARSGGEKLCKKLNGTMNVVIWAQRIDPETLLTVGSEEKAFEYKMQSGNVIEEPFETTFLIG